MSYFDQITYRGKPLVRDESTGVEYWVVPIRYVPIVFQRMYWNIRAKRGNFSYKFWSGTMKRMSYEDLIKNLYEKH